MRILVGLMVFVVVLLACMAIIPALTDQVNETRSSSGLNCTSTEISTGTKWTCVLTDTIMPVFISFVLAAAAGYVTMKNDIVQ